VADRVLPNSCGIGSGRGVVEDLAPQAQTKFIRSLELLEVYGLMLRQPWVKNIHGIPKLRELRFTSFGEIYRVFFFPVSRRKLILLHGFKKKSQETPSGSSKQPKLG
jgi:phage-related protein